MGKKDLRVDAYINKSGDFAKPILNQIRKLVHSGCPDVEETLKWSMPHFMHKGMLCGMAAFTSHCTFGFWKSTLLDEKLKAMAKGDGPAMGQFGRITNISDLPDENTLIQLVKEAAALNEQGIKLPPRAKPKGKRELDIPNYFMNALRKNKKALSTFEGFNYSNKKEYVEWVAEAKSEETRKRRLETAVEWMAQGKVRNWKYIKC